MMYITREQEQNKVFEVIKRLDFFTGIPDDVLKSISNHCVILTISDNNVLITQDEVPENFFIVCSGELEVSIQRQGEDKVVLDRLLPGDYYGEICLLTGESSSVNIVTVKKSEVLIFADTGFNQLVVAVPDFNQRIIRKISDRLRKVNEEIWAARNKELALAGLVTESKLDYKELVGHSRFIKALRKKIDQLAANDDSVLINGDIGTGKVMVGYLIHKESGRKENPFIIAECDELVHDQEGNKIFGHSVTEEITGRFGYLELAHGGTLLLNQVELLPRKTWERLSQYLTSANDVRIIMTSGVKDPGKYLAQKIPNLNAGILFKNIVYLEPLAYRKRDIPDLIKYFIHLSCEKYGKQDLSLSQEALEKLLAHDYQQGNIQQLEQIVDRAVVLTDGDSLAAHTIILDDVNVIQPGYNLLQGRVLKKLITTKIWPNVIQLIVTGLFLLLLANCFWGSGGAFNWGSTFLWSAIGPFLLMWSVLLARAACSICPFSFIGTMAQKVKCFNYPVPSYISKNYYMIMIGLFGLIFWFEEFNQLRFSPVLTGLLLLFILSGAVICSVLYDRQVWCRYMCPLGAVVGVCATIALVELRAKTDICQNKCTTHNCYKGNSMSGCPMFLHGLFIDSNVNCKLCFHCLINCPNDAIKFNLRPSAREIWNLSNVDGGMAVFVAFLGLLLLPALVLKYWHIVYPQGWQGVFSLTYWSLFSLLGLIFLVGLKKTVFAHQVSAVRISFSFIPLIIGAHMAYQLGKVTQLREIVFQLINIHGHKQFFSSDLINMAQIHLLTIGLVFTIICLTKVHGKVAEKKIVKGAFLAVAGYYLLVLRGLLWL